MSKELLNTLSDILHGEPVPAVSDEVLCEAKKHSLSSLFPVDADQAMWKYVQFDYEYEKLTAFLEQQGIWYLPMKGILLREFYPQPWQRDFCDYDILVDSSKREPVADWFIQRGYTHSECSNCDSFIKKPVLNFEIHNILFEARTPWFDAFSLEKIEKKMKSEGCRRSFSDEDFYIYNILHWLKHFTGSGTGLRTLVDEYLLLRAKVATLDWRYIQDELRRLPGSMGVMPLAFENMLRTVSQKVLDGEPLTEDETDFLQNFDEAGTYGNKEIRIRNDIRKTKNGSRLQYLVNRAFPPLSWYQELHPFLYRVRVLIPFFCLFRLLTAVLTKAGRILREMGVVLRGGDKPPSENRR